MPDDLESGRVQRCLNRQRDISSAGYEVLRCENSSARCCYRQVLFAQLRSGWSGKINRSFVRDLERYERAFAGRMLRQDGKMRLFGAHTSLLRGPRLKIGARSVRSRGCERRQNLAPAVPFRMRSVEAIRCLPPRRRQPQPTAIRPHRLHKLSDRPTDLGILPRLRRGACSRVRFWCGEGVERSLQLPPGLQPKRAGWPRQMWPGDALARCALHFRDRRGAAKHLRGLTTQGQGGIRFTNDKRATQSSRPSTGNLTRLGA